MIFQRMRLLVICLPELYESRRLVEEGRKLGHKISAADFERLAFVVRPGRRTVLLGGRDIFKNFDVIYFRYLFPDVSEGLMLAEWAASRGLTVIDRKLAEKNYIYNKVYAGWKLAEAGLPVPGGFQVFNQGRALAELKRGKFPVVAKGVHGSRGRYVFKINSLAQAKRQLTDDLAGFFTFQDCLETEKEYRILVVGGKPIGAMLKTPPPGEFRANIATGAFGSAAKLPRRLLDMCAKSARVMGYEFAGIDLGLVRGKPYIFEVNRTPGFEGFEEATGINVAKAFIEYAARKVAKL
jgi:ribosomal protein S6--L-glutamate ligase